jgi:hypothetical protein
LILLKKNMLNGARGAARRVLSVNGKPLSNFN